MKTNGVADQQPAMKGKHFDVRENRLSHRNNKNKNSCNKKNLRVLRVNLA